MSSEVMNGRPEAVSDHGIRLDLSFEEAQAVKSWLLKAAGDGSSALDDEALKPVMLRLGQALDYVEGVEKVRQELEQAGLPTERLTDEQVAELGRRISEAPLRRMPSSG